MATLGHARCSANHSNQSPGDNAMNAANPAGDPAPSHFPTYHVHHHDPESAKWALAQEEQAQREHREKLKTRHAYFYFAGRVLLALLFVSSAVAKMVRFDDVRSTIASLGLSATSLLLTSAIVIELVGGVTIGLGYRVRWAAAALIAYLAVATLFFVQ